MLPQPHRLRRRADFSRVVRRGRRVGRRDLVVHALLLEPECHARRVCRDDRNTAIALGDVPVFFGGMRVGLIVSKAVGGAVVRHRVARRLRHICTVVMFEQCKRRVRDDESRRMPCAQSDSEVPRGPGEKRHRLEGDTAAEADGRRASILADVVVRALPGAAHASSGELERQLRWIMKALSACWADSEVRSHAGGRER